MNIVGRVGDPLPGDEPIGPLSGLKQTLSDQVVDDVVLCLAASEAHLGDELIAACREQGKSTYVAIDVAGSSLAEGEWLHVDTIPVLAVSKSGELRINASRQASLRRGILGDRTPSPLPRFPGGRRGDSR